MSAVGNANRAAMVAQQRLAGEAITYRIGDEFSLELTAVPTAPQFQLTGESTVVIDQTQYRDWQVIADELVRDDDQPIVPDSGHVIDWIDRDGVLHRFEVGSANGSEVWRWMDAQQVGRRIHSLQVSAE